MVLRIDFIAIPFYASFSVVGHGFADAERRRLSVVAGDPEGRMGLAGGKEYFFSFYSGLALFNLFRVNYRIFSLSLDPETQHANPRFNLCLC